MGRRKKPGKSRLWFGKYKGFQIRRVPKDYLVWLVGTTSPSEDGKSLLETIRVCAKYLAGTAGLDDDLKWVADGYAMGLIIQKARAKSKRRPLARGLGVCNDSNRKGD